MNLFKSIILFVLIILITKTTSSPDDADGPLDDAVDKRTLTAEEQESRKEHVKDAMLTLTAAVASLLSISNPISAATVAIGSIAFATLLKDFQVGKADLWDSLEDRIDIKIGAKLASSKVHDLKEQVLYPLNRRIMKDTRFVPEDLEEILDRMPMVIPSNKEIGWNYDLPLAMVYYLPYMISGYHKVIADGKQPSCALANDMQTYRTKVVTGIKEMMRKRYKSIYGKEYNKERVNYYEKKHNITKRGWVVNKKKKSRVSIDRLLTYEDTVTKKTFTVRLRHGNWHGKTWNQAINKIRDKTVDFLYKEVIEKINKFFIPKICLESLGCTCPDKITREEIVFDYPSTCFGSRECVHPAARFDYSYYWCYTSSRADVSIKTNRVDFDSCMPVRQQYIEPLNILDD